MKRFIYGICIMLLLGFSPVRWAAQSAEVIRMMDYIVLAEQAGLNVQKYLMELSDQLAIISATNYMDTEILQQGEAAARLYAHPLVCMNYAACLMKQRKYGSALHYLAVAWHQDKRNHMLATNIARCHFELGDDKLAEAFLDRALQLNKDYGLALQLKATILLNKGDIESQNKAVEYVFKSALDTWNHVSVRHFNSIAAILEDMYDIYRDTLQLPKYNNSIVKLTTPIDDFVDLIPQIQQAGQTQKPNIQFEKFVYPIPDRNLEYQEHLVMGALKGAFAESPDFITAAIGDEYMQKAMKLAYPTKSDYPAEYSGLVGGNGYLPDSRAFNVTVVAYMYHQIKLLEARHNLNTNVDIQMEPIDNRVGMAVDGVAERMHNDKNLHIGNPWAIKSYGDELYALVKQVVTPAVRYRIESYDQYMKPALENYQKDIKQGLYYITNKDAHKYLQTRYDYDVVKLYEDNELMYFSEMQRSLNWSHSMASDGEAMINYFSQRQIETRDQRFEEWKINQDLKAAGMEGIGEYPVPSINAQIGGYKFSIGADKMGRIYTSVEDSKGIRKTVYNPETGASSSTVLKPVKAKEAVGGIGNGRTPYNLPDGYMAKVDLSKNPEALLGDFSEGTSVMRGVETVTDARGNVLVSNFKTRTSMTQTQGIPTGPSVNIAGYDFDGIPKTWKDYINPSINRINSYNSTQRLGSSIVSSSQRSTRGFTLGLGKGNSDLVSIGVGFQ
ncbi:MAG: tetratricopeptide repeat protein [Bacteroidales bacterium]|nr:tetratricopeptide repeat protein [Bacteroidales bacterium]